MSDYVDDRPGFDINDSDAVRGLVGYPDSCPVGAKGWVPRLSSDWD